MGPTEALALLRKLAISPPTWTHDAVMTVADWRACGVVPTAPNYVFTKNLILKGKKGPPVMVIAAADTPTDMKTVATVLSLPKDLRFGSPELLAEMGTKAGSVSPFLLAFNPPQDLIVAVDTVLINTEHSILFHPGENTHTVALSAAEFAQFLEHTAHAAYKVVDFAAAPAETEAPKDKAPAAKAAKATAPGVKAAAAAAADAGVHFHELGVVHKLATGADFADWYQEVITKSEMLEYYEGVSGCYVLRPWAFSIWEAIQRYFDDRIKLSGVENCSFPMFVSKACLEREQDHLADFTPEVAWVTKCGQADLPEPIAIRPTSETVMYPYYAKWIRSHRDLPLRLNQWCNVVRWEFSHPTPFIRTREFLWQEGHSAFFTRKEAEAEVYEILDYYRGVYEELLAVPVTPGIKTRKETFAGAVFTTTVEGFIPRVGRGIQGATSHYLGTNFAKMFNINIQDPRTEEHPTADADMVGPEKGKLWPHQNSWGITTRTLGVMTMVHADDTGLVLPPRVAPIQVAIVACGIVAKTTEEQKAQIIAAGDHIAAALQQAGIRAKHDKRSQYTPGWRFNYWELKGVPLRLEVGPRDIGAHTVSCIRRCDGKKFPFTGVDYSKLADARGEIATKFAADVAAALNTVHDVMFSKAKADREAHTSTVMTWDELIHALNRNHVIMVPHCNNIDCEKAVKEQSAAAALAAIETGEVDERAPSMGAKALCIPITQPPLQSGTPCVRKGCSDLAVHWTLFGRSY